MRDEQLLILNDYLPRVEVVDLEELFFGGGGCSSDLCGLFLSLLVERRN